MPLEPLSQKEIEDRLAELPGWSLQGDRIARSYRLPSHFAATAMVVHIAQSRRSSTTTPISPWATTRCHSP